MNLLIILIFWYRVYHVCSKSNMYWKLKTIRYLVFEFNEKKLSKYEIPENRNMCSICSICSELLWQIWKRNTCSHCSKYHEGHFSHERFFDYFQDMLNCFIFNSLREIMQSLSNVLHPLQEFYLIDVLCVCKLISLEK